MPSLWLYEGIEWLRRGGGKRRRWWYAEKRGRDATRASYNYGRRVSAADKAHATVFQRTRCLCLYFTRRVISHASYRSIILPETPPRTPPSAPTPLRPPRSAQTTMPSQQFIVHPADLPYVPTIMRAPSPSSTIGTDYGPDETDLADSELSEREFVRKCEGMAGINRPRPEEDEANRDPLLHPRPLRQKLTPQEENCTSTYISLQCLG